MKLAIAITLAAGLLLQYPAFASSQKTLRKECTQSRCIYYEGSKRVFSVEKEEGTSRLVVRDADRRVRAKVRENSSGTIEVKEPD